LHGAIIGQEFFNSQALYVVLLKKVLANISKL